MSWVAAVGKPRGNASGHLCPSAPSTASPSMASTSPASHSSAACSPPMLPPSAASASSMAVGTQTKAPCTRSTTLPPLSARSADTWKRRGVNEPSPPAPSTASSRLLVPFNGRSARDWVQCPTSPDAIHARRRSKGAEPPLPSAEREALVRDSVSLSPSSSSPSSPSALPCHSTPSSLLSLSALSANPSSSFLSSLSSLSSLSTPSSLLSISALSTHPSSSSLSPPPSWPEVNGTWSWPSPATTL